MINLANVSNIIPIYNETVLIMCTFNLSICNNSHIQVFGLSPVKANTTLPQADFFPDDTMV